MATPQLLSWCTSEIAKALALPEEDAKGVASYVLSFPDEGKVRDYLRDVLGTNSSFTDELIERRFHPAPNQTQAQAAKEQPQKPAKGAGRGRGRGQPQAKPLPQLQPQAPRPIDPGVMNNATIFEKKDVDDDFWGAGRGKKGKKPGKPKTSGKEYEQYVDPNTLNKPYNVFQTPILIEKKKGKGGVPEPPKRMECGCQGSVHPYVNNCLECGRIACEIEGEGDCYFCGNRIEWHPPTEETTPVTSGVFQRKTLAQATTKTFLYDDQTDYYNLNDTWLTPEEKEKLREREKKKFEEAEERKRKFTFDFAGRKILSIYEDEDV